MDKAILVGLNLHENIDIMYQIEELKNLCEASDILAIDYVIQDIDINNTYYVGKGKLEEIKVKIDVLDANIVVFNDELTPAQLRNIENYLAIKVIDRSLLILDIFSKRAMTYESKLEVELSQLKYMLPRLQGLSSSLSRQGSGFNAKGPGEKKIELDRRYLSDNIIKIKRKLDEVNKAKENSRTRRLKNDIFSVCLVGYTNAGKSSLMNRLVTEFGFNKEKTVYAKDQLFATLQTSSRHIILNDNTEFLLSDTVGFISKLPHHLVESFKSTLIEAINADLLIHVIDVSNKYYDEQIKVTNNVLKALGSKAQMIYVFNKCDLLDKQFFPEYDNSILISIKENQNIYLLINMIKEYVSKKTKVYELLIPYSNYGLINKLHESEYIIKKEELDSYVLIHARIKDSSIHLYKDFIKR